MLKLIESEGEMLGTKTRENAALMRASLSGIKGVDVVGSEHKYNQDSPLIHIRFSEEVSKEKGIALEYKLFSDAFNQLVEQDIVVCMPDYAENDFNKPSPSLKIGVTAGHTAKEIKATAKAIHKVFKNILKSVQQQEESEEEEEEEEVVEKKTTRRRSTRGKK